MVAKFTGSGIKKPNQNPLCLLTAVNGMEGEGRAVMLVSGHNVADGNFLLRLKF